MTSWVTVSFSRRTLLHGVNHYTRLIRLRNTTEMYVNVILQVTCRLYMSQELSLCPNVYHYRKLFLWVLMRSVKCIISARGLLQHDVTFQVEVFWALTSCSFVVGYERFGDQCCFLLQGDATRVNAVFVWLCKKLLSGPPNRVLWHPGTAPRIVNLSTIWRWVASFTPRPLYPRNKSPRYPFDIEMDGYDRWSVRSGEENPGRLGQWFSTFVRQRPGKFFF
jgi:hypothetical protein